MVLLALRKRCRFSGQGENGACGYLWIGSSKMFGVFHVQLSEMMIQDLKTSSVLELGEKTYISNLRHLKSAVFHFLLFIEATLGCSEVS